MSAPTAKELLERLAMTDVVHPERQLLASRVEAVLALHVEGRESRRGICSGCGANWPCSTVRLLDGEKL